MSWLKKIICENNNAHQLAVSLVGILYKLFLECDQVWQNIGHVKDWIRQKEEFAKTAIDRVTKFSQLHNLNWDTNFIILISRKIILYDIQLDAYNGFKDDEVSTFETLVQEAEKHIIEYNKERTK